MEWVSLCENNPLYMILIKRILKVLLFFTMYCFIPRATLTSRWNQKVNIDKCRIATHQLLCAKMRFLRSFTWKKKWYLHRALSVYRALLYLHEKQNLHWMEVKINNTTKTSSLRIFSMTRSTNTSNIDVFSYVYQNKILENIIIIT